MPLPIHIYTDNYPSLSPLSHPPSFSLPSLPSLPSCSSTRAKCIVHLPEECLHEIFEHLSADISALHALVLVSRTFFRITVPILYADPFHLLESNKTWAPQERGKRYAQLLYLFMNCCTEYRRSSKPSNNGNKPLVHSLLWTNLPPICPVFQSNNVALEKPLIDYLAAYRHHFLWMNLVSIFQTLFPNIQRHHISNHVAALSNQVNITTTIFTRNEIERTLLLHQPDRIKTLSLPIQRLPAFESIGPYLSNLVRFELFGISWLFDFNPAIKFVQQHSMLFGTIQELKLTGPDDVHLLQKPGLHQMLNSIKSPRVIDLSKFKEAAKDMSSYELQSYQTLEVLLFDLNFVPPLPSPSFPTLHDMQTSTQPNLINGPKYIQHEVDHSLDLIQKCSRMTTLHVGVQSSTAFTWAVSKYDADPSRIQPFKTLRLSSNETGTIKQALEDCVYAFRDTIEELEGIAFCNSSFDPALSRSPSFRWTWYLQRLTVLSLEGEIATWFDMNSLKFCPKLTEFKLVLYPYSPVKAEYIEDIILAPQIKVLSFRGRWILTDSLMCILGDGLLKLEKLLVDGCECDELTDNGLFQGLNKMKALKTFEVELGQRIGTLMRLYRPTRPDLSIRMRSDEAPWLDDETRLTPVFRPY